MEKVGLRVVGVCAMAAVAGTAAAQSLTGVNWYTLNAAHQYTGGYANTYGGDTYSRNLYGTENQNVGQGSLLNAQNLKTLPTRVQVDLSVPGTYTFQMYCNGDSSGITPYWGLNLFFDTNDLQPGISVRNAVDTAGFQTIDPIGTPTLDPFTMGLVQTSSGTSSIPVYQSLNTKIQLTAYSTWSASHYNVDRVDNFTDMGGLGNGVKDQVIEFTLKVTPVPEPGSLLVLGGFTLILAIRRRAKASRS